MTFVITFQVSLSVWKQLCPNGKQKLLGIQEEHSVEAESEQMTGNKLQCLVLAVLEEKVNNLLAFQRSLLEEVNNLFTSLRRLQEECVKQDSIDGLLQQTKEFIVCTTNCLQFCHIETQEQQNSDMQVTKVEQADTETSVELKEQDQDTSLVNVQQDRKN